MYFETYPFKLESPQSRAQVAADWLLSIFFRPAVTQIRDLIDEGRREPDEARIPEVPEPDGRQGARVGAEEPLDNGQQSSPHPDVTLLR